MIQKPLLPYKVENLDKPIPMDKQALNYIERLIDDKIRQHEIRAGRVTGIVGILFMVGVIHSIWLLKVSLP